MITKTARAIGKTPSNSVRASSGTNTPISSTAAAISSSKVSCQRNDRRNSGRPTTATARITSPWNQIPIHGGQPQRTVGRLLRTQSRVHVEMRLADRKCLGGTRRRGIAFGHPLDQFLVADAPQSERNRRGIAPLFVGPGPASWPTGHLVRADSRTRRPSARPGRPGRRAESSWPGVPAILYRSSRTKGLSISWSASGAKMTPVDSRSGFTARPLIRKGCASNVGLSPASRWPGVAERSATGRWLGSTARLG